MTNGDPELKQMVKYLTAIFILILGFHAGAQQDSAYIRDFRDYGNLSFALEAKGNAIGILGEENEFLLLSTNNGVPTYGLMFSYKWLNARLTTSAGNLTYSSPNRGTTDNLGLALGYTGDRWWIRGFYEGYRGYYIANPESYDPSWFRNHTSFPVKPDLRSRTLYTNIYYGFNGDEYSHRAMMWQSQRQKKSAGSLMVGMSAGYDRIISDSTIIPSDATPEFDVLSNVSGYETITLAVNVGYAYSIVLPGRWSLGLMFTPGLAGTFGEIEQISGSDRKIPFEWGVMSEARAQLAYHGEKWFGGLSANSYLLTKPVRGELFNNLHTYVRFNVGYRLAMPKSRFLRKFGLSD